MRVLVTGGAGYIGSHTAKVLARIGHDPVVLDNLSTGHDWAVRWGPLVRGDLADGDLIREVLHRHRIDAVIHFAANAYVGESMANPRKYFRNNVANTINLLDAMVDAGVRRIVFSSSCTVYGMPERLPLTEDHPTCPVSPYGESKLFCEKLIRWYGQAYDMEWVALRYFNASGADTDGEIGEQHDPETHLIPLVLQAALGVRPHVEILGTDYPTPDGTAIRDYVHVLDLAAAHARALDYLRWGNPSDIFNLGNGQGYSVQEVIRTVERVTGRSVPVRAAPRRAGDPPALGANPPRAIDLLGWQPAFGTLDTIVETAYRWHATVGQVAAGQIEAAA